MLTEFDNFSNYFYCLIRKMKHLKQIGVNSLRGLNTSESMGLIMILFDIFYMSVYQTIHKTMYMSINVLFD